MLSGRAFIFELPLYNWNFSKLSEAVLLGFGPIAVGFSGSDVRWGWWDLGGFGAGAGDAEFFGHSHQVS